METHGKEVRILLDHQRCIICGQPFKTGLSVMGCFICFPCEKMLLNPLSGAYLTKEQLSNLRRIVQSA